jgi:hypothetical protein
VLDLANLVIESEQVREHFKLEFGRKIEPGVEYRQLCARAFVACIKRLQRLGIRHRVRFGLLVEHSLLGRMLW